MNHLSTPNVHLDGCRVVAAAQSQHGDHGVALIHRLEPECWFVAEWTDNLWHDELVFGYDHKNMNDACTLFVAKSAPIVQSYPSWAQEPSHPAGTTCEHCHREMRENTLCVCQQVRRDGLS